MSVILFLIQWIGGVYCLNGDLEDVDVGIWVLCFFMGWIFIIIYIVGCLQTNTSSSSNSSPSSSDKEPLSPNNDYNTSQNLSKPTQDKQAQNTSKTLAENNESFYSYVTHMSDTELINTINNQYKNI